MQSKHQFEIDADGTLSFNGENFVTWGETEERRMYAKKIPYAIWLSRDGRRSVQCEHGRWRKDIALEETKFNRATDDGRRSLCRWGFAAESDQAVINVASLSGYLKKPRHVDKATHDRRNRFIGASWRTGRLVSIRGGPSFISGQLGILGFFGPAKFARDSGANGILIDVQRWKTGQKQNEFGELPVLDIPVIITDSLQSEAIKTVLREASKANLPVSVSLGPTKHMSLLRKVQTIPVGGFQETFPNILDKGVFPALLVLLFIFAVIILLKVKWHRRNSTDISLCKLAESALSKMEIKKFKPVKKCKGSMVPGYNGETELLTSCRASLNSLDMCAICLEGYKEEEVRVFIVEATVQLEYLSTRC
ncbi:unnamed protein product [Soboliphyme baturini]|uniref:RING-type E3 ubiquitin transferase n=1 Tax=Soboliphyme baturini TaxID=241478 RepID=A0A183IW87_9BILA|nr:unnamed protein product [Soboliphyme baturini]